MATTSRLRCWQVVGGSARLLGRDDIDRCAEEQGTRDILDEIRASIPEIRRTGNRTPPTWLGYNAASPDSPVRIRTEFSRE